MITRLHCQKVVFIVIKNIIISLIGRLHKQEVTFFLQVSFFLVLDILYLELKTSTFEERDYL